MFVLRAFLILLMLAMTPMQAASAAGMPLPNAAMVTAIAVTSTHADCCEDGSHRTPACQMLTDLRDTPGLCAPLRSARLLRAPPTAARLTGRAPSPALPPPRRA